MRILVLGDFSGAQDRPPLAERRPRAVDLDNLEDLMGRMGVRVGLRLDDGSAVEIGLQELDEFHPDTLYRRLDLFARLRDLHRRLRSDSDYAVAATELRSLLNMPSAADKASAETQTPTANTEDDAATLDRLLGRPAGAAGHESRGEDAALAGLLREAIADHIVPDADPGQQVYRDAADQAIAELMRSVLHHPAFRAREALWRGLHFLVTRLELDEELQLFVLDVAKEELLEDVRQAGQQLDGSATYRLLAEHAGFDAESWSLLVGHYRFSTSEDDALLLAALGSIAECAGGPFLAEADAAILGCRSWTETPDPRDWQVAEDVAQRWAALRQSSAAKWIGLALPRMLMRLPYGEATDEIDAFPFEELADPEDPDQYLWGNPALACAALIGQAYRERGWQMEPGDLRDIGDLPAHSYRLEGESRLTPCAEIYLTEAAADRIIERGLMPLVSIRGSNAARLLRFQSIADPPSPLAGF